MSRVPALRALQALHAVTRFPKEWSPPRMRGCTWSTVSSPTSNRSPQYTHRYSSRSKICSRRMDPLLPPLPSRRNLLNAAQRYLLEPDEEKLARAAGEPPRLTSQAIKKVGMSRSRERILANVDDMYREAFERAKAAGDEAQMATLDFAYRREQLYFEILLDVRDALERR